MIDVNLDVTVGRFAAKRDFCVLRIELEETQRREIADHSAGLRAVLPTAK